MKRSGFKKAYDDLEIEYKIREAVIVQRIKGIKHKELAEKLGVTQAALKRFEVNGEDPTLAFLLKVTAGLGLKLMVK